jgi:hypothetical protein
MKNILTIEEFFEQHIQKGVNNTHSNYLNIAIEFTKLHITKALKKAEEIAIDFDCEGNYDNSILNAYPLENIK